MNTVSLDMTITAEQALKEFDALPESAPKQKRDAYWRRYARLQNGLTDACTYTESTPPAKAAPPAARLEVIKQVAVRTHAQPKPAAATRPPAVRRKPAQSNLPRGCRTSVIPASKHAEIHYRINRQLADMGWGAPGIGIPAPFGAVTALQKLTGIGTSDYHHTIRAGTCILPHVLKKLHDTMGIREEWLLNGTGDNLWKEIPAAVYSRMPTKSAPPAPLQHPPASRALADLFRELSQLAGKIAEACGNESSSGTGSAEQPRAGKGASAPSQFPASQG